MSEAPLAPPFQVSKPTPAFFLGEKAGPASGVEVGGLTPLRDLRVPVLRRLRLNLPTTNPRGKNNSTVW